jgi:hypothetical protein
MKRMNWLSAALVLTLTSTFAACGGGDSDGSSAWVGKSYVLTIPADNWTDPPGIGGDIGDFVPQFMFGVAKGSNGLDVTIGTATDSVQNDCNVTTAVSASGSAYPLVTITTPTLNMHIVDTNQTPTVVVDTTVRDVTFKDVLPGTPSKQGTVVATIDAAEVYPLFRLIPDATKESVCDALAQANAPCTACPHNGEPYCLTIKAVQVEGVEASAAIKTITTSDLPASCSAAQ